jgi:alkanesulfonate monooxygenase SsuD/methylene tetrahydromethanopterin reductase-like flavin-dependent oxidoreductase (luciferase family)
MSAAGDAATSVTPDAIEDPAARGDLSVFLATSATKDPLRTYRDSLESIRAAEALGYSYAWVAEAHFSSIIALPVALAFLAAATQISDRIRLGTAVVPLAFDAPLRLAETAALVNALSGERLEFGVGKGNARGFSTDAYSAFGLDEGDRNELFVRALEAVKTALRDPIAVGDKEVMIYPPSGGLLDRIWQATGHRATAAAAGKAGDGLLLFRTVLEGIAGEVQSLLVDSYLDAFASSGAGSRPRIGVSRSLLIASSRREAIAIAQADFEARSADHPLLPEGTDAASVEKFLVGFDVAFGSVDDVVETLNGDAAVSRSTNYLFSLPFAATGSDAYKQGLDVVATEVYPRLRRRAN